MTTESRTHLTLCEEGTQSVESFRLREAVVGDGLILVRRPADRLELFSVQGGRGRPLGTYATIQEAWKALDRIDAAGHAGSLRRAA